MREFVYLRAHSGAQAIEWSGHAGARFFAGGTTLYDLMKLGVESPRTVIDVTGIDEARGVDGSSRTELRIGAMTTMAEAAGSEPLRREFPALAQSLDKAASQQLRNMATLGGNLLQRTRCSYFRGAPEFACNKRVPGSGCSAHDGMNRGHAVLGGSTSCVAVYPGDWAVALTAFDATLDVVGPQGSRSVAVADLHREPGRDPHRETTLEPGELILRIRIPRSPVARSSVYHKIRDRESYAFALASAAVGLHIEAGRVVQARIALGGVATRPWRSFAAEASLIGKPLTRQAVRAAAEMAFDGAVPLQHNAFKVNLGIETVADALWMAKDRT